jgi:hypothetical protein
MEDLVKINLFPGLWHNGKYKILVFFYQLYTQDYHWLSYSFSALGYGLPSLCHSDEEFI